MLNDIRQLKYILYSCHGDKMEKMNDYQKLLYQSLKFNNTTRDILHGSRLHYSVRRANSRGGVVRMRARARSLLLGGRTGLGRTGFKGGIRATK